MNESGKWAEYLRVRTGESSYCVDRFYDVFYRLDIVAERLRGDDISGLANITMKDVRQFTSLPTIEKIVKEVQTEFADHEKLARRASIYLCHKHSGQRLGK